MKKENSKAQLEMDNKNLSLVKEILKEVIPSKIVWAYGSRVKGTSKKHSDLDLVVFDLEPKKLYQLKETFEESNIPFRVDIMDWGKIPVSYQENIKEKYIVMQE